MDLFISSPVSLNSSTTIFNSPIEAIAICRTRSTVYNPAPAAGNSCPYLKRMVGPLPRIMVLYESSAITRDIDRHPIWRFSSRVSYSSTLYTSRYTPSFGPLISLVLTRGHKRQHALVVEYTTSLAIIGNTVDPGPSGVIGCIFTSNIARGRATVHSLESIGYRLEYGNTVYRFQ